VRSVVFTSSLLVCRNGYVPKNDQDFCPPNLYGESKVEGERLIRAAGDLPFEWKVVRPTSVWGPWFEHSYRSFFRMVSMGLYVHPGATPIHKPLTFVGNTVQTMLRLLTTPSDDDVYYLVDYPQRSIQEWANTIRLQINNKRVRTAPVSLLRFGAVAGDILKALTRRDMPLTSFRLNNMLTGGSYPIDNTKALVGPLPYTMEQGVDRTLSWMRATKQIG
jgi:nucleoside-diphosphate-sugar epimerase